MDEKKGTEDSRFFRGQLAKLSGTNIETVRYYERVRLLPPLQRTDGGYRVYGHDDLKRLMFIRRSRELGFTLDQVRGLLKFVDEHDYSCADVQTLTLEHLDEVKHKIADLKKMEQVLEQMADRCEGGEVPDCPIIEALFGAAMNG